MATHHSTAIHRVDGHRFWCRKSYHRDDHRLLWLRCVRPNNSSIAIGESKCGFVAFFSKIVEFYVAKFSNFCSILVHHSITYHKSQSMSMHCCRWEKIDVLESRYSNSIHLSTLSLSTKTHWIQCYECKSDVFFVVNFKPHFSHLFYSVMPWAHHCRHFMRRLWSSLELRFPLPKY